MEILNNNSLQNMTCFQQVQRTMLELLNQLDGFSSNNEIKVWS